MNAVILTLCLCLPLCTGAAIPTDDRTRAKLLHQRARIDPQLDLFVTPLDSAFVQDLLQASATGGPRTRLTALMILGGAVADRAFADASDVPRVAEAITEMKAATRSDSEEAMAMERIAWHLQVQGAAPVTQRSLLEKPFSERSQKVAPYQVAAMEYLVALGADGAEVVRRARESGHCAYQDACELALQRIAIREQIATLGSSSQSVAILLDAMETPNLRFRRWVMGELSRLRPVSDAALEQLARDPGGSDLLRHAARTALRPGAARLAW